MDHAERTARAHPNLVYAEPDRGHRLPIRWLRAGLDEPELNARFMASRLREVPEASKAVAEPNDLLHAIISDQV
jgi:hypothetical protein